MKSLVLNFNKNKEINEKIKNKIILIKTKIILHHMLLQVSNCSSLHILFLIKITLRCCLSLRYFRRMNNIFIRSQIYFLMKEQRLNKKLTLYLF